MNTFLSKTKLILLLLLAVFIAIGAKECGRKNRNVKASSSDVNYNTFTINAPSALTVTFVSNNQINITWVDNSLNNDYFIIEKRISGFGGEGAWQEIATVGADINVYQDFDISPFTSYYYRLYGSNTVGDRSSYSNEININSLANTVWPRVACGGNHTLGSMPDGSLWGWGGNESGQLGLDDNIGRNTPSQVASQTDWSVFDAGFSFSLAIKTSGSIWSWGYNGDGELGIGSTEYDEYIPVRIGSENEWKSIIASSSHTIAQKTDGTIWSWGLNNYGQLGLNDLFVRYTPEKIGSDTDWAKVVNFSQHNVAIKTNKTLWGWGLNDYGFLGLGYVGGNVKVPTQIGIDTNWSEIAASGYTTTAIKTNGTIWTCGYSYGGVLGLGSVGYVTNFTQIGTEADWSKVSSGNAHTIALKTNGTLWAWGSNGNSQLGLGFWGGSRNTPTQIPIALRDWSLISCGEQHTCALTTNSLLYVWGTNDLGQLGMGDIIDRNFPCIIGSPAPPSNCYALFYDTDQINLYWGDQAANESGFIIERRQYQSEDPWDVIATVDANVASYPDIGVSGAKSYRIKAFNALGESSPSNEDWDYTRIPAPSDLELQIISSTQIALSWVDNSIDEDGFRIERSTDGITYTQIATVGYNFNIWYDTTVSPGTAYYYKIKSFNSLRESVYSNAVTTLPGNYITLDLPGSISCSIVNLSWDWAYGSEAADGYEIERSMTDNTNYVQIGTVSQIGSGPFTYTDTGLIVGYKYYYRVRGFNAFGVGGYSNDTSIVIPGMPASFNRTIVSNVQIDFSWTDTCNSEDGFKIERSVTTNTAYSQVATVGANANSWSDTTATEGTKYYYRLRVYTAFGDSPYTVEINSAPVTPTLNTLTVSTPTMQVSLAWANLADEQGFKIERNSGAGWAEIATVGINVLTWAETVISITGTYDYRVKAYGYFGDSASSGEKSALPIPWLSVYTEDPNIRLQWGVTSDMNHVSGFIIERKTGSGGTYEGIATYNKNTTALTDTTVSMADYYYYRIRAFNDLCYGRYSTERTHKPFAPSVLTRTITSGSPDISFSWVDNSVNEDLFRLERKERYTAWELITTVISDTTTATDTITAPGLGYFIYRIRAYNSLGYSNEAAVNTLPAVPTVLTYSIIASDQIRLQWVDNSGNEEDSFKIYRKPGLSTTGFEVININQANTTTYIDNALIPGTGAYYYKVTSSHDYFGEGNDSNEVNTYLYSPTQLNRMISQTAIILSWVNPITSGLRTGFIVERSWQNDTNFIPISTVNNAGISLYEDNAITTDNNYYYRIKAINEIGNYSGYSNVISSMPSAPVFLTLVSDSPAPGDNTLLWANTSDDTQGFKIERKEGAGGTWSQINTVGADIFSWIDSPAPADSYYRVRCYNYFTNSDYTSGYTPGEAPLSPSALSLVLVSTSQINLLWTDKSDTEIGFKIERSWMDETNYAQIATVGQNIEIYSDSVVSPDNIYYYRIRAYNIFGDGEYSLSAGASTEVGTWVVIATSGGDTSGNAHSLGIKTDNTLWAWGYNMYYQLGLGDTDDWNDRNSPTQAGTDSDWSQIAAGVLHSHAIKTNKTLWAWGDNTTYGQLGLGNTDFPYDYVAPPTQVGSSSDWDSVASGDNHIHAIKTNNTIWSWGTNANGELGLGYVNTMEIAPLQTGTDSDWSSVTAGNGHSLAIKLNQTLWSWGYNNQGQLGLGDSGAVNNRNTPTQVGTASDWSAINCGALFSFGIKTDGSLWSWGQNANGQLGLGDSGLTKRRITPTQVGTDSDWANVSAGEKHTIALKSNGSIWGFGENNNSIPKWQLTNYVTGGINHVNPIQIGTDANWIAVSSGGGFNILIKNNNMAWSWGQNTTGQLGLGHWFNLSTPSKIGN